MTKKITTKDKILDAAEQLFATTGFAETSMRQITTKAGVNLASVNYHFGSKKALIKAVVDRYLHLFLPSLLDEINALEKQKSNFTVEELFTCFKRPLLNLEQVSAEGAIYFIRLIGRGYIDFQGHLRKFITDKYGEELEQLQNAFRKTMPELSEADVFWRLHFTMGTSVFTLSAADALKDISKVDFGKEMDTEAILDQLLPYLAAGFAN